MKGGKDRVAPDHPGARVAHDLPDPLPHVGTVAVDGAVGTGGLIIAVGAFVESPSGIVCKLAAFGAKTRLSPMMIAAENPDHGLDGLALSGEPGMGVCHSL